MSTYFGGFQILIFTQFVVQCNHSLLCADIGRSSLCLYFRSFLKFDISTIAFAFSFQLSGKHLIFLIFPYAIIFKCFIELHDEVATECLGVVYKTLVIHPTGYLSFYRINFNFAHIRISVNHQISVSGRGIGKTQMHAAGSRSHFGSNAIIERYFVIMGLGYFIVMTELRGPFILIHNQFSYHRHKGIYSIITHPRAALMRLTESPDIIDCILIFPAFSVLSCLCRPCMHGIRHTCGRVCIAITQAEMRVGTLQCIDILHEILHLGIYTC